MQHLTPNESEKMHIEAIFNAPFPATLKTLAEQFNTTELESAQKLSPENCAFVQPSFPEVFSPLWQELCSWQKVTLFLVHDSHIFEIQATLSSGKESHGFYNILNHHATIGGHLQPKAIQCAAFLTMPFMGRESLSVQFFNHQGHVSFSVYAGRENHQIIPGVKAAFFKARAHFCA